METEENGFVCDCDGVGYTGETCDILLINAPELSSLTVNSQIEFFMSSSPDRQFTLDLVSDDRKSLKVKPSSMIFSQTHTHYNITIQAKKPGKYTLKYRVKDQTLKYQPVPPATILVTNGTIEKSNYFDKYGVKPGILKSGCCSSETLLQITCPTSRVDPLFLKSTCGWTEKGILYSPGIIFSSDNVFDMPIAIAGAKVRQQRSSISLLSLSKDEFESDCMKCSDGSSGNILKSDEQCNIMPISLNDVQSFLCHESLASTYFHHSSRLIPKWLKFITLSSNRTHDMHSYIIDLVSSDNLKTIGECSKLTALTSGLYSVLLYSGSLKVKIDKESVLSQSNRSSGFCFAVNLCEGASSPLYIGIPDEAQALLRSLELMRDLNSKGWTITINSLLISDSKKRKSDIVENIVYWNGKEYFISYRRQPNMVTSVKFNKQFYSDDTVKANWIFSGDIHCLSDDINKVCTMPCAHIIFLF